MVVSKLEDLFVEQLRDLYNAESQVQLALERWAEAADSTELKQLFTDRIEQASRHITRVQEICNALGVTPAGEKCYGMQGLVEEGDSYIEESESGPVRDAGLIANAQRIEHYGIAGYGCARTHAERLGHEEAAEALQKNVDESAEMDARMTELAETLLNPEAQEVSA
ncbi:MAG: ferritin-like domain-containing protein [Salinibacter sp.]|uniref:ferritin-like domain-containing protein n=1 Tax=Salinibacter sp. TaxID=2065818 RepID=UPI0035D401B0